MVPPIRNQIVFAAFLVVLASLVKGADTADLPKTTGILDLTNLKKLPNAERSLCQNAGSLIYSYDAGDMTLEEIVNFHREQILKAGFEEVPGSPWPWFERHSRNTFVRDGFFVSFYLYNYGYKDNSNLSIEIYNNGNIDPRTLPHPQGFELVSRAEDPSWSEFSGVGAVGEVKKSVEELLVTDGWIPFGSHIHGRKYYRKQAIVLDYVVYKNVERNGNASVLYSLKTLPFDFPTPIECKALNYDVPFREVSFETTLKEAQVVEFYRSTLSKSGWRFSADSPLQTKRHKVFKFLNHAQDEVSILIPLSNDSRRIGIRHRSAIEVEDGNAMNAEFDSNNP